MSKKKRFGISEALTRGLSETINVVENNAGIFRNVVLPLSRVELDPENPRKLAINLEDVRKGVHSDDPLFQQKSSELDKLKELAHTIKNNGIINPIVVYKKGEFYRVVAGERRCLASILTGKQEIEARVFNDKPKNFDLKLIQWIENTAREDLSLDERLGNVRDMIREYQLQHKNVSMTATLLKNLTGLSLSQCTYYLSVLSAPDDVQNYIKNGAINNLDKAALLSSITSTELREQVIQACINGSSLKALRYLVHQQKSSQRRLTGSPFSKLSPLDKRGRNATRINMGTTTHPDVIKMIVNCVTQHQSYDKYADLFNDIHWHDLRQSTKAFRKLVELLEFEMTAL